MAHFALAHHRESGLSRNSPRVRDHKGQALAYVYFEDAGAARAAKLLTRDEACRIDFRFNECRELKLSAL
jgi:hypothetical protein